MNQSRLNFISLRLTNIILFVLPLSLALNLINHYSLDSVFVIFILVGVAWSIKTQNSLLLNYLNFKESPVNLFFILFFLSGFLGYLFNSPMLEKQWGEILGLRWIFGFYGACFFGQFFYKKNGSLALFSLPTLLTLCWLTQRHLAQNEGRSFGIDIRFMGFYENTNHYALAFCLLWTYFLGLSFFEKNNKKALSLSVLTLLLGLITILATYSRSAWLALVAAFCVAAFYTRKKEPIILGGAVGLILAISIFMNVFNLKDRIIYSLDTSSFNSQVSRMTVWKVAGQIFLDHPWFGVGFEENVRKYPEYYKKLGFESEYIVGHAHNQYLEVLSGAGIFGLIGYLGAFITGIVYFHRRLKVATSNKEKQVALGAILLIVALMCSSFTDATFRLHEARNYVLLLLGFSYGYLKTAKSSSFSGSSAI
ncbi:MAG: O-antigen ligase family protein [Bdellovibrio sp.]|nr:O-antigen ligase family protein [Bdellovibrio sp.]